MSPSTADLLRYSSLKQFDRALAEVRSLLERDADSPYLLEHKARLIQLSETPGSLDEAEEALLRANTLHPSRIECLEDLAHFFDAVRDDPETAARFARECLARIEDVQSRMRRILEESRAGNDDPPPK